MRSKFKKERVVRIQLTAAVRAFFSDNAASFDLNPRSLIVDYVLNEGGFVNHSFCITDGKHCFHLKLATSEHSRAELLRWHRLSALLERYRAPAIIDWIDVGAAGGLLFSCLPGTTPRFDSMIVSKVLAVTRQLNRD